METLQDTSTMNVIASSLKKAMTYKQYKALMSQLVAEDATTGEDQTEALINYTKLNDRRMKRLDKTVKLAEAIEEKAKNYTKRVTWLVLTESWCGDAAQLLPVMNKVAGLSDQIDLKIVMRDENPELMDRFLTNGGRAIPKLIAIDEAAKQVVGEFGPRPSIATRMVDDFKAQHGSLTPEFKQDLQIWYNKDKGRNAAEDLAKLLA